MPDAFYQDLPTLSDTEVRVLLVAHANSKLAMSIKEMQARTGRTRQVYEAIKTLERRGLLQRERVDDQTWRWRTSYVEVLQSAMLPEAPKTKAKKVKTEKPPAPVTSQQHPAVIAYTEVTRRRPSHAVADQIAAQVTDIERWQTNVRDYVMRGWNPLNVAGMLRVYHGEMKITTGRRTIAIDIPHAPAADTQKAWEQYLIENEGGGDD